MNRKLRNGWSSATDTRQVVTDLVQKLGGAEARAIVFFASHRHDGAGISAGLREHFPAAEVIGCTTAGEFTEGHHGTGGVTALLLGPDLVQAAAGALADCRRGVTEGVGAAVRQLETKLGRSLREAEPQKHVGIALVEGLKMREEAINEALGNASPLISFVGGSAGDDLEFKQTRVFHNGNQVDDGAALLVLRCAVPFHVAKTCSFESSGRTFTVTKADVENRVIYELDGKPVTQVYAEAAGVSPEKLDGQVFMRHPVGLIIDGKPWIRSPQRVLPDGGLKFYCQVLAGTRIHLMNATDLVRDTRTALESAKKELGGQLSGGLVFNCILRRLDIDAQKLHDPFYSSFKGLTVAGFHTYGESWLGHINQTLTGVFFG